MRPPKAALYRVNSQEPARRAALLIVSRTVSTSFFFSAGFGGTHWAGFGNFPIMLIPVRHQFNSDREPKPLMPVCAAPIDDEAGAPNPISAVHGAGKRRDVTRFRSFLPHLTVWQAN